MTTRSCPKQNSTTCQAVDEQIRQKAQNRYAESMNDTQRKWIAVGVVATAVVLIGSQLLLASPPTFNQFAIGTVPRATLAPAAPVVASPAVAALATASSQPKITWSTTSVNVILSPGESTSSDLTFTSSQKLTNVTLSVVPQIAPFVTVQPSSISSLAANQAQAVHLSIAIATNTAFGTYDGTLQLKSGTTTFPQTVKVVVNVWQAVGSTSLGVTLKIPPTYTTETSTFTAPSQVQPPTLHSGASFRSNTDGYFVNVGTYPNTNSVALQDWYGAVIRGQEFGGSDTEPGGDGVASITTTSINGMLSLDVRGDVFGYIQRRLFFQRDSSSVVEVSLTYPDNMMQPDELTQILGTLQLH